MSPVAAAATEAETPAGWVVSIGSFRISVAETPSASLFVTCLSDANLVVASCNYIITNLPNYFKEQKYCIIRTLPELNDERWLLLKCQRVWSCPRQCCGWLCGGGNSTRYYVIAACGLHFSRLNGSRIAPFHWLLSCCECGGFNCITNSDPTSCSLLICRKRRCQRCRLAVLPIHLYPNSVPNSNSFQIRKQIQNRFKPRSNTLLSKSKQNQSLTYFRVEEAKIKIKRWKNGWRKELTSF